MGCKTRGQAVVLIVSLSPCFMVPAVWQAGDHTAMAHVGTWEPQDSRLGGPVGSVPEASRDEPERRLGGGTAEQEAEARDEADLLVGDGCRAKGQGLRPWPLF